MTLRMAVVGVGHLGKEHARILNSLPDVDLVGVADANLSQAQAVADKLGTQAFAECWPLLNLVDAASIVVPTVLHARIAEEFLKRGIPLLIEKPLALNVKEAEHLVRLADENKTFIQVGHIERFNPAFEEIQRRPMQPKFIRAERLGPYTGRSTDIGVVLDLMIHDLDLLLTLVDAPVMFVQALGIRVFGDREDIANARLHFANGCIADVTASRSHPVPHRRMHVWSPEGYADIDFAQRSVTLIRPSEELRQHGLDVNKLDPASRSRLRDELFTRHFETQHVSGKTCDQLTAELQQFTDCVRSRTAPLVTGRDGRDAIALAERILASMERHSWNGISAGPTGPKDIPTPLGALFPSEVHKEAA